MGNVLDLEGFRRKKRLNELEKGWNNQNKEVKELNDLLLESAEKGNLMEVRTLLDKGAEVNAKNEMKCTGLHFAAERGDTEMAILLIKRGADVNVNDILKHSPLHYAVSGFHLGTADLLMKNGAAVDDNVLRTAGEIGKKELIDLLKAYQKR